MSSTVKNVLKFILFLAIGVGLIYLIVRGITPQDWENIKNAAANANYTWLGVSLVLGLISHLVRAERWRMLIEPVAEKPKFSNTFFSVMIGYMANYAPLPRLGEVYRCGILSRYSKAPLLSLVGTVIVERAIDLLVLVLFFFAMLALRFQKVFTVIKPRMDRFLDEKMAKTHQLNPIIIGVVLIVIIAAIVFLVRRQTRFLGFVKKYVANFWDGIKSVGKLKKPILFWTYSVGIWVLYLLSTYVTLFCFGETSNLTLADGLVILIFGSLGVIITPGGTGAYQLLISNALIYIYLISKPVSVALAWLIWGSQLVLIVTLGLISLMLLPILNKNDKTGGVASEGSK